MEEFRACEQGIAKDLSAAYTAMDGGGTGSGYVDYIFK